MGALLFYSSGLVMIIFELYWFAQWWGAIGVVAGLLIPPLAALFPFIYLFVEGFSVLYFGVWALGLFGAWLMAQREEAYG